MFRRLMLLVVPLAAAMLDAQPARQPFGVCPPFPLRDEAGNVITLPPIRARPRAMRPRPLASPRCPPDQPLRGCPDTLSQKRHLIVMFGQRPLPNGLNRGGQAWA